VPYLKAALLGLLIALAFGAAVGLRESAKVEGARYGSAEAKARAYADGIATGLNCAALFALVCVPAAIVVLLVRRRRRVQQ